MGRLEAASSREQLYWLSRNDCHVPALLQYVVFVVTPGLVLAALVTDRRQRTTTVGCTTGGCVRFTVCVGGSMHRWYDSVACVTKLVAESRIVTSTRLAWTLDGASGISQVEPTFGITFLLVHSQKHWMIFQ